MVAPDADNLVALMHRPKQSYFLIPQVSSVLVAMIHLTLLKLFARYKSSMMLLVVATFTPYV